ncbi:MAG TPA: twin-arginine translocation signal domain-containing protein, partial [Prolixibacteraceae bacterium]|nr:twin-arginine translocation signal domain-containing protein [Prolixibacteraceae bacterium]
MGVEQSATSRRNFIKTAATSLAAITILPSHVVAGLGHRPPSSRLSIAAIGVGGVGFKNLNAMNEENIVALCDIDKSYGLKAFRRWPAAV